MSHHKPSQMSVERRRVSVARALANAETGLGRRRQANVDVGSQQLVIDMLRNSCQEEGVALILVTHAPQVSSQFDRVDRLTDINLVAKEKVEEPLYPTG